MGAGWADGWMDGWNWVVVRNWMGREGLDMGSINENTVTKLYTFFWFYLNDGFAQTLQHFDN